GRRSNILAHCEDALCELSEEPGASTAPHIEVGLRSCDGPKIRQVVVQGIASAQDRLAVLEHVPGKTDSRTKIILVNVVEWLLRQADKTIRVGFGIVGQEICTY